MNRGFFCRKSMTRRSRLFDRIRPSGMQYHRLWDIDYRSVLLAAFVAAGALVTVDASAADRGLPAGRSVHRLSLHDPLTDHVNYLLYVPPAYARETALRMAAHPVPPRQRAEGRRPADAAGPGPPGIRGEEQGLSLHHDHSPVPEQHALAPEDREESAGLRGIDGSRGPLPRLSHRLQPGWLRDLADRRGVSGHVCRHCPAVRHERSP